MRTLRFDLGFFASTKGGGTSLITASGATVLKLARSSGESADRTTYPGKVLFAIGTYFCIERDFVAAVITKESGLVPVGTFLLSGLHAVL